MAALPVQVQRRLITVDEYEQMIQAGVFPEDDRLELIEGELIEMSPTIPNGSPSLEISYCSSRLEIQQRLMTGPLSCLCTLGAAYWRLSHSRIRRSRLPRYFVPAD
jgi:hypothetical protein